MSNQDLVKVEVIRGVLDNGKEQCGVGCCLHMHRNEAVTLSEGRDPVVRIVTTMPVSKPESAAPSNVAPLPPKKAPAEQPAAPVAPEDPAVRMTAIKAAIESLDKADKSLWLKDGVTPDVKAIESVLGWNITAAERDEAVK
jgi:hypothetical protein